MSPIPIETAPADTARAMHAAEMRGQDMQDAPERIYRQPGFKAEFVTAIPFERAAIPATAYITEAECQRRIDAAVQAERDACEDMLNKVAAAVADEAPLTASAFGTAAAAIRARGQK